MEPKIDVYADASTVSKEYIIDPADGFRHRSHAGLIDHLMRKPVT
jgi:hypothetical protein